MKILKNYFSNFELYCIIKKDLIFLTRGSILWYFRKDKQKGIVHYEEKKGVKY